MDIAKNGLPPSVLGRKKDEAESMSGWRQTFDEAAILDGRRWRRENKGRYECGLVGVSGRLHRAVVFLFRHPLNPFVTLRAKELMQVHETKPFYWHKSDFLTTSKRNLPFSSLLTLIRQSPIQSPKTPPPSSL